MQVFDRNGDGHVTAQELREVLENTGEYMKREDIDELIATADCNGDGRIDYEGECAEPRSRSLITLILLN